MDLKRIKALLEKYYNGESSSEEEKILYDYFLHDEVSPDLVADKDIFIYNFHQKKDLEKIPDISEKIWNNLIDHKEQIPVSRKFFSWSLRIAASIIVIIASYFIMKNKLLFTLHSCQLIFFWL